MRKLNHTSKQGVIAIVDISLYTIENGKLKALNKKVSEEKLRSSVLNSLDKFYPEDEILTNEFEDEIEYLSINL